MDVANFTNPLTAVQAIPIFIYINILSDFLGGEKLLNEKHLHQPIPIVNALYNYFFNDNEHFKNASLETKKMYLAKKLINGTDYFGAKGNETLDENFINALFKHIITTLVFTKYVNIYGFFAEIIYRSNNLDLQFFYYKIRTTLSKEKFQNENGPDSSLEPIAVYKICNDLIFPMIPKPGKDFNLSSIDYIYAQAGAIFQMAAENPPIIKLSSCLHYEATDMAKKFIEYQIIAHSVEQSVNTGEVNETALRIFTLPALIYYVYKEKENFTISRIASIVNNATHIGEAINQLFLYINTTYSNIEKAQEDDHRYQYHLAISHFKSRSTLANKIINETCSGFSNKDIENAVTDYENNPKSYKCNNKLLPDINSLYQEQVDNVTKKYFVNELQSMREAFGIDRINSVNDKVRIFEGFFVPNPSRQAIGDFQLIEKSSNMFRLYFPDNGTYINYAFLRKDDLVTLIQGSDNDQDFKQKLGLQRETIENRNFYIKNWNYARVKTITELLNAIAEEKKIEFSKSLYSSGYNETRLEWWKDFGKSLIPFYSCAQGVKSHAVEDATISCSLDIFFLLPLVGEFGMFASKLVTATTKSIISLAGATLESIMLRTAVRQTLSTLGEILVKEVVSEFSSILTKATFKDLGLSVVRFLDPGFELVFSIGKGGYRFLGKMLTKALGNHFLATKFPSLMKMLEKCEERIAIFGRKLDVMRERDIYVNYISEEANSGYGYKYTNLPSGEIAEIRTVAESEEKVLVVFDRTAEGNQKIYKRIDPVTGDVINKELFEHNGQLYEHPISRRTELKFDIFKECEKLRRKRSPTGIACVTTKLLNEERMINEAAAVNFAVEQLGLSETEVRNELRKYIFPDEGNFQMSFVQELEISGENNKWKLPDWSEQYRISESEMFFRLRYEEVLNKADFTEKEAEDIIKAMFDNLEDVDDALTDSVDIFLSVYRDEKLNKYVTIEDFFALMNYINFGYDRIGLATLESKCMREAFYRLAVRQLDRVAHFPTKLFRGETRSANDVKELFFSGRENFQFDRFTSTSTMEGVTEEFINNGELEHVNVIYHMDFDGPYLCANLENGINDMQNEVVLLPGTKFEIKNIVKMTGQNTVLVELTYLHDYASKEQMLKYLMDELEKLKNGHLLPYFLKFNRWNFTRSPVYFTYTYM